MGRQRPMPLVGVAEANVTYYFQAFDDGTNDGVAGGNLTFTLVEAELIVGVDHGVEGVTPIVITTESTFDNAETYNATGTFAVPQGADAYGCIGGSLVDLERNPNPWDCCVIYNTFAEEVGFEPTVSFPTHAFQACRFGRSRTPPCCGTRRFRNGS